MAPAWARPLATFVGLLVAYFSFPLRLDSAAGTVVSLLLTTLGLGLVTLIMVTELRHLRHGTAGRSAKILALLIVLLVMMFSLAFFLLNRVDPDQVAGLDTRTDALYFTLSTMATVGYGDVHAEGQLARAMVCALIAFNVVVVASLYREHASRRARS